MTVPTLPDNIWKLFAFAGVFFIAYSYVEVQGSDNTYFNKLDAFNSSVDSINLEIIKLNHQRDEIYQTADFLSIKHQVENPISKKNNKIYFNQVIRGKLSDVTVSDTLSKLWSLIKEAEFKIELYNNEFDTKQEMLKQIKEEHIENSKSFKISTTLGALCFLVGFVGMVNTQKIQDELLKRQLLEKPKLYRFCQSCGKTFTSIRQQSKNKDGSVNSAFCTTCYLDGEFTEPELTKEEFDKRCQIEVKKVKSRIGKNRLLNRFSSLERWSSNDYS